MHRVFAMILAAGQARRMGQFKQLMPYGDGTLLDAVIQAVLDSSVDGLVVVANQPVRQHLADSLPERCVLALNEDADSEMIVSVQLGYQTLRDHFQPAARDGVMVLLADQPQITAGIITTCAESYRRPRTPPGIVIATYGGRHGHPTVFSVEMLDEIADWSPDRRLNELAHLHPEAVRELPITTAPMPLDVNTPEDYDRLG